MSGAIGGTAQAAQPFNLSEAILRALSSPDEMARITQHATKLVQDAESEAKTIRTNLAADVSNAQASIATATAQANEILRKATERAERLVADAEKERDAAIEQAASAGKRLKEIEGKLAAAQSALDAIGAEIAAQFAEREAKVVEAEKRAEGVLAAAVKREKDASIAQGVAEDLQAQLKSKLDALKAVMTG